MSAGKRTRINKYLSEVGVCSRRAADQWIEDGRVTVNGVIPEIGTKIGADDVVHNFNRWLDPNIGSSNLGLFSSMTTSYDTGEKNDDGSPKMGTKMKEGAVEKVDDHTVRLHLNRERFG